MSSDIEQLARDFDHHNPDTAQVIYDVYAHLREHAPCAVSSHHGGFRVLSRYDDVYRVMQDPATFSSSAFFVPQVPHGLGAMPPTELDPPDHEKYRAFLQRWFSLQRAQAFEPSVRAKAASLLDVVVERGHGDLASEFAYPLVLDMISGIMGVPAEDRGAFATWIEQLGNLEEMAEAFGQIFAYFGKLVALRREEPLDDVVSVVATAQVDGEPLSEIEAVKTCFVLQVAGFDTTAATISNVLWYLGTHPEDRARLAADRALIPSAIEELLRYIGPGQGVGREVVREAEVAGETVPAGECLYLAAASANRDERQFPQADEVILDRHPNRHVAFGTGIHRCLGMHFARIEVKAAVDEVLDRVPDYRIADGFVPTWAPGQVSGLRTLPVVCNA